MKLVLAIFLLGLGLSLCQAGTWRREATDMGDNNADAVADTANVDGSAVETTAKPLGVLAIKARVITKDPGLCQKLSRYHPHYPDCQSYCQRLEHWIGMCRDGSCLCIS